MKVLFRVDASYGIGSGHVLRCLSIANYLFKKNYECFFLIRKEKKNYENLIKKSNHKVHTFSISADKFYSPKKKISDFNYKDYDWRNDFYFTEKYISKIKPDIIFLDHYYLNYKWQTKIFNLCKKFVVIDDQLNRKHKCNYYLNSSLINFNKSIILKNYFLHKTKLLTGIEFALLDENYLLYKRLKKNINFQNNILISFGGADPTNETMKCIKAIEMFKNKDLKFIIITGKYNKNFLKIKKYIYSKKLINIIKLIKHTNVMYKLIAKSFIGIGACGISTWERACLGLPTIVIGTAENQKNIAKIIMQKNMGIYLGESAKVTHLQIFKKLSKLMKHKKELDQMRENCLKSVDGKGIARLYNYIKK